MAGMPPMPPGFDPSKLPPMPPGMDFSKMPMPPPGMDFSKLPPMPPGFDPSKLPPMPAGMPPMPPGMMPPMPGVPPAGRGGPRGDDGGRGPRHSSGRGGPPMHHLGGPPAGGMMPAPPGLEFQMMTGGPGGPMPGVYPPQAGGMSPPPSGAPQQHKSRQHPLREPTNTVWLGNTPQAQYSDDMLFEFFSKFGRIMRIGRLNDKGVSFVHFHTVDSACDAVNEALATGALGDVQVNYGKLCSYAPEELDQPEWRPRRRFHQEGGDDTFGGNRRFERDNREHDDRDDRDHRRHREEPETNVLWVGELNSAVSTELLKRTFDDFGTISAIHRPENKNMAFIHFETIDECKHAQSIMRGVPIAGYIPKLGFGKSLRADGRGGNEIPTNERVNNVVFVGNLPPPVNIDDLNELFDMYPGYIDCKLLADTRIAFGHFDTDEHAKECRTALQGYELYGVTLKVSYGKSPHTRTMADRYDAKKEAPPMGGQLVAVGDSSGALLPTEFGLAQEQADLEAALAQPKYLTRVRPAPSVTIDTRIATLLAASYYACGESEKPLMKERVDDLIKMVDECNSEEDMKKISDFVLQVAGFSLPHCIAVIIKRLKSFHSENARKKGYCFYAVAQVLFTQGKALAEYDPKLKPMLFSFDLFELLASLAIQGTGDAGFDGVSSVLSAMLSGFLKDTDPDVVAAYRRIAEKKKVAAGFSKLLASVKAK